MSTLEQTIDAPNRVSVHFPDDVLTKLNTAEETLGKKVPSRNFIITLATELGLPAVLKRYKDATEVIPFSDSVANVVASYTKSQNITTEGVCEKMRKDGFDMDEADLISKVSQCLVRLEKRGNLKFHNLDGRKRVYRRVK
jgi:hypothetical protein